MLKSLTRDLCSYFKNNDIQDSLNKKIRINKLFRIDPSIVADRCLEWTRLHRKVPNLIFLNNRKDEITILRKRKLNLNEINKK